ncbi:hypothetical protein H6F95_18405 [Cyanobacteria bacterium FACHB-471]|nr:hypothetical protein [Cyanobacteria bacterium FACHB-471]
MLKRLTVVGITVVASALTIVAPAQAEVNLAYVDTNEDGINYYIDLNSITRTGDHVEYIQSANDQTQSWFTVDVMRGNCATGEMQFQLGREYDADGTQTSAYDIPGEITIVPLGSVGETMLNTACNN